MLLPLLPACESHEKKVDDAFDREKKARVEYSDTATVYCNPNVAEVTKVVMVTDTVSEWTLFKTAIEKKIYQSENRIRELKAADKQVQNQARYAKQLTRLEQKNNDLRKRMNDYNEEVSIKWEKFKSGMNHDLDEVGIELRDVKINNK